MEDSGAGLTDGEKSLLFEPYRRISRTSQETAGSGLGLALSKQLILALSGNIGVKDSVLGGCAFWFTLPRASNLELD